MSQSFNLTQKGVKAFGFISKKIQQVKENYHSSQVFSRVVFECGNYNQCIIDYSFGDKNPDVLADMIKYGYAE